MPIERLVRSRVVRSRAVLLGVVAALGVGLSAPGPAAVAASPVAAAPAPAGHGAGSLLGFRGEVVLPTGTQFADTEVGGLSGITYDRRRDLYYAISDDRSEIDPARFYTLRIRVRDGSLDAGDLSIVRVTTLLRPDGTPFPALSLDPESIALTRRGTLVITSEGDASRDIDPFVREFSLSGRHLRDYPVPDRYSPEAGVRGVRTNLGFESAGISPSGRSLFTATEGALVQDGPAADIGVPSPARLLRYDVRSGRLVREHVYWTDPVAEAPTPPTAFRVNGLVELLPLSEQFLLALERSFSVGAGNTVKLYGVALPGATDVRRYDSLAGRLDRVRPVRKHLLYDFDELGIPLDNLEGMTFGPRLPDGRRTLLVVSDNNFSPAAFTQFLLFVVPGH
jgi:3-phytase/alkaline phosphatase D